MDCHLSGCMKLKLRQRCPQSVDESWILNDEGIHTDLIEIGCIGHSFLQLIVFQKGIQRDIYPNIIAVAVIYRFFELFFSEVGGIGSGGEFGSAKINCVGSILYSHHQGFHTACWC